jgi:4-hydroxybenzoate polyprenyltransferase
MALKKTIHNYLQLFRIQTAAATASAPLIGALIMGQHNIFSLIIICMIGLLYHIYGFVLNEYMDSEIDKKSAYFSHKPLVAGTICKRNALSIVIGTGVSSCIIIIIFFPTPLPVLLLICALLFGGIYDIFGKKFPGSDFILGISFFFICLTGAGTVSYRFNTLTLVMCSIYFVHIVFNNAVEGGIKDIEHDSLAGTKTLIQWMNVTLENGKLKVTKRFLVVGYVLRIIFICLICRIVFYGDISQWFSIDNIVFLILLVLLVIVMCIVLFKFLHMPKYERSFLKKLFSIHEIVSYSVVVISLTPILDPVTIFFLLILPLLWYILFNLVLTGRPLEPNV